MRPRSVAVLVATASMLATAGALAQPTASGFALDRFNPSERGSEWFALDSLDLRGQARPAIGLVGELADSPLVIYNADGTRRDTPVRYQLVLHPGGSLVLWDRLRIGFDLPVAAYQDGTTGVVGGVTYAGVTSANLGDLRLSADVRLLGEYGDVFRLAAGAQVFVPIGSQAGYLSDGTTRVIIPRALAAGDVGVFSYAASLGFNYRGQTEVFGGTALGSEFVFGASAGVRTADRNLLVGPELYGSTVVTRGAAFDTTNTPVELLLGAHYLLASSVRLGLGVAPGLTRGLGEPAVRYLASVEYAPQPPPEAAPPADRDHDGVPDDEDACPDDPGVKTDDPKTNGCPPPAAPPPPADRDHDGIPDADDACPDVPGVKTDDPKTNGCPPDRDHDGVPDKDDACPDVPGVKTDDPKTNGCPPDRDHDGIIDSEDACPDTPGPRNADPKKNGCPEAAVVGNKIFILEQVKFQTGSAKILPASDAILNAVLGVLRDHPDIKHVSIEGHTDNVGAAAMNKGLSSRRAASVVAWLVAHGVERGRLSSAGFGMERPIDSNETPEGRQNNRRVEFHIDDGTSK